MDQNKPKFDMYHSNVERNNAKCYISNERGETALQEVVQNSAVFSAVCEF